MSAAFIDAARKFLVEPSEEQRTYLASISQGFFLYHLLGKDPSGGRIRRELFEKTLWLIDSSVLIPFAARGCHNHEYAVDLLARLRDAGGTFFTTTALLQEVFEHFDWARRFIAKHPVYSPEFLLAALARLSYKQNLFLDGYIRLAAEGKVSTFSEYQRLLFPSGRTYDSISRAVLSNGLKIIDLSDLEGSEQIDYGEQIAIEEAVRSERMERGSFRSDLQVRAEAEVFQIVRRLSNGSLKITSFPGQPTRVYFVSQSRVLDSISPGTIITWSPEAVYRYLSALPGSVLSPELLQQCMLNDYYNAGVSFIDKARYEKFFSPFVNSAKAGFREQKEQYLKYVESTQNLDEAFDKTEDLDKPLFVEQMMARIARIAEARASTATKRADAAEARVKALEAEKAAAWKKRELARQKQEAATQRHKQDAGYLKKRARQVAKRAKKKKSKKQ